jgi:hypothetical protein
VKTVDVSRVVGSEGHHPECWASVICLDPCNEDHVYEAVCPLPATEPVGLCRAHHTEVLEGVPAFGGKPVRASDKYRAFEVA